MNRLLFLFLIILFALLICPLLGLGMREGMYSQTQTQPVVYTGKNGGTATVTKYSDETIIQVSPVGAQPGTGQTDVYYIDNTNTDPTKIVYICSSNGNKAVITTDKTTGMKTVTIYYSDGSTETYSYDASDTTDTTNTSNTSNTTDTSSTSNTSNTTDTSNTSNTSSTSNTSNTTVYYGPNCATATVTSTTITITGPNGGQGSGTVYTISTNNTSSDPYKTVYVGPNGNTATIVQYNNGDKGVEIKTSDGQITVFYLNNSYYDNSSCYYSDNNNNQYPPPPPPPPSPSTSTSTSTSSYYGPNGGQVQTITGPNGNTYASYDSSSYSNSSSTYAGIPKSQIPPGDEDLYILKSQIVPPVCPACPASINNIDIQGGASKCPPCPACARCPEPSFECKKVPNYKTISSDLLPMPYVNDFSAF
jgi:hypothetical protein